MAKKDAALWAAFSWSGRAGRLHPDAGGMCSGGRRGARCRSVLRGRARDPAPLAVGRHAKRPGDHAHRRRVGGDRRPRARRRLLGVRVRPAVSTRPARGRRRSAPAPSPPRPGATGPAALAPLETRSGTFRPPAEIDPFAVPLGDKVALCLRAEEAMRRPEVKVAQASVRAQRERKLFLSSDGAEIEQELVESGGGIDATAVGDDGVVQQRSYPSAHVGSSAQAGLGVRRGARSRTRGAAGRRAGGHSCSAPTSARRA